MYPPDTRICTGAGELEQAMSSAEIPMIKVIFSNFMAALLAYCGPGPCAFLTMQGIFLF